MRSHVKRLEKTSIYVENVSDRILDKKVWQNCGKVNEYVSNIIISIVMLDTYTYSYSN